MEPNYDPLWEEDNCPASPSFSARNPAKRIRAESEEISRPAQFSAHAGNGAVREISEPDKPISRVYDGYYRQLNFSV